MEYAFFVHAINLMYPIIYEEDEEVRLKRMLRDAYNDVPVVELDDAREGLLLHIGTLPNGLRERVETYLKDRLENSLIST